MKEVNEYSLLTTKQAARLINVHESSVKRWCKDGQMIHNVTDGGHRRIHIADLLAFAKDRDQICSLADFAGDSAKIWSLFRDAESKNGYEGLVHQGYAWIRDFKAPFFKKLVFFCLEQGLSFSEIFDHLIARILQRIGDDWHTNQLDVGSEHYMTEIVRDLLYEVRAMQTLVSQTTDNPRTKPLAHRPNTAIVGCNEGNTHDIGAHALRMVLEQAGWQVIFLGADVPTSEFAKMQTRHNAQLLCISFVTANSIATASRIVEILAKFYDTAHPYHLALGGQSFPEEASRSLTTAPFTSLEIYRTIHDLSGWLQHHQSSIAA